MWIADFLARPKKFNIVFMKKFMYHLRAAQLALRLHHVRRFALRFHVNGTAFQTGWFLESIATQTLVVNIIRSKFNFW